MVERWFLVPVSGSGVDGDPYRPKYEGTTDITGWSGQIVTVSGSDQYAVRFYGTAAALDNIESNSDATSIEESGLSKSDIATELNERTGHSYSFSEWEQRFLTA